MSSGAASSSSMPSVGSSDVPPPGSGRLVGRIQFIWPTTGSSDSCLVKAICLCTGHADYASAKRAASGNKQRGECYLLLYAALDPFGRWEDCARWLAMGRDGEEHAAQHMRDAEDIRQQFKVARAAKAKAKAKPKAATCTTMKSPKVPKVSATKSTSIRLC